MFSEGRDIYEKKIETLLSILAVKLKCENNNGKQAYNKTAESIMCGLLNMMYGFRLEVEDRPNFPGIDLSDQKHRVGIQITTQNSLEKVRNTLEKVKNSAECSSISRLIILVLTFEKPSESMKKLEADRWFVGSKDIWTLNTIVNDLQRENSDTLKGIVEYLEKEIGSWETPQLSKTPDHDDEQMKQAEEAVGQHSVRDIAPTPQEQPQKEPSQPKPAKRLWKAGLVALLGIIIAVWALCSPPRYEVSSPESRELLMWEQVEDILCDGSLEKTAIPLSVYDSGLNSSGSLGSIKTYSYSYPFAIQCAQIPVDPICAFRAIGKEYFTQDTTGFALGTGGPNDWYSDVWSDYLFRIPYGPASEWEWSESGVEAFLGDMLALAGKCNDRFDFDDRFLSAIHGSQEAAVHFSDEDQCYYVSFIYYGDYTCHAVSMYFYPDQESGTRISDVEFQFLNTEYFVAGGAGSSISWREIVNGNEAQIIAMIVSTEYLLTGCSGLEEDLLEWDENDDILIIPTKYWMGDHQAAILAHSYETTIMYDETAGAVTEDCELITYRLNRIAS